MKKRPTRVTLFCRPTYASHECLRKPIAKLLMLKFQPIWFEIFKKEPNELYAFALEKTIFLLIFVLLQKNY
ncbi:hypothetical protein BpHYR1_037573 [Brachionus plicatilis]|uniref:Uncharacterized protein n=1 Tax=Brachionus plicatilis TaxID=10195 RepID=A0A3M7RAG6_BRAPC|nr:hypothetical protein BpHYR1_037573 [Brachionus plicatilis]